MKTGVGNDGEGLEAPRVTILGSAAEAAASDVAGPALGRQAASLPASPADHDGMYRGLLWVAWAVEEVSRGFTRLSCRIADVERRLDRLDSESDSNGAVKHDQPVGHDEGKLDRLEARIDESQSDAARRIDAVEERLRQLDFLPLKVSNLQRTVDQLESAQKRTVTASPAASVPPASSEREMRELRRELSVTNRRLSALEAQVGKEPVPAVVEAAVRRHAERLASKQEPGAAADLQGVYRELDAVAEFVAARAASTDERLERIAPLEVAVLELRRDLRRALAQLAADHGATDAEVRLRDIEKRLGRLELSGRKADRLLSALEDAVKIGQPDELHPGRPGT